MPLDKFIGFVSKYVASLLIVDPKWVLSISSVVIKSIFFLYIIGKFVDVDWWAIVKLQDFINWAVLFLISLKSLK